MAHRASLLNYASGIVGDHARAEDLVQEAYLRFDSAAGPDAGATLVQEPVGYLYRIVRNLAVDGRRQQAREARVMITGADTQAEQAAADHPSPESQVAAKAELRALQAAMAELPERTRVALEMHRFGGHKLKDIAAHLGISIGLAHKLVVDGLEHCRARLHRQK
ncbi:MAG: sigma-70 family RNA polymerase sigma factor [Azospirillaceae bacterium]|nr:sigma-70 family RNA polymerase sigma factor [Azospirillaceae bacterium]